jgi:branched-chain amino acid transport system substrate-binding protein
MRRRSEMERRGGWRRAARLAVAGGGGALAVTAAGVALASAAPGGATASTSPVTVPFIMQLSGPNAPYSQSEKIAAQLAVAKVNGSGGIDGHKLVVDYEDGQSSPAVTSSLVSKATSNALMLLGPEGSAYAGAGFAIAKSVGIPSVTASVSDASIIAKYRPWAFDTYPPAQNFDRASAEDWLKVAHVKTVVEIVATDDDASVLHGQLLVNTLKANGVKVLKVLDTTTTTVDFSSIAAVAKSLHPQGLVVSVNVPGGAPLMKALRSDGVNQPVLYSDVTAAAAALSLGGAAMNNGWVSQTWYPQLNDAGSKAFLKSYLKMSKGAAPESTAPNAYNAVLLAANALTTSQVMTKNSGKSLSQKRVLIRDALVHAKVTGIGGAVSFTSSGVVAENGYFLKVVNGKYVPAA